MAEAPYTPGSRAISIPMPSSRRQALSSLDMPRGDSHDSTSDEATSTSSSVPKGKEQMQSTPAQPRQRKDKQRASEPASGVSAPMSMSSPRPSLSYSYTNTSLSPSMLSSTSYKSVSLSSHSRYSRHRFSVDESPDVPREPERIICYTKHSQGFTWNDEMFLPSYMIGRSKKYRAPLAPGGHRVTYRHDDDEDMEDDDDGGEFDEMGEKCPVFDVFVTDEEAKAMLP